MSEIMRVVIGYDGSATSDVMLADLEQAGLPKRLDVLVVTAANVSLPSYLEMAAGDQAVLVQEMDVARKFAMEKAESEANEASKRLKTIFPLWNIQSEVYPESPTWALTKRASEWKANLLVVGAHGHTRLGRFIGSVSQLILLQAPCSVRVARAPQEKSKGEPLKILIGVDGSKEAEAALAVVKKREWPNGTQVRILSVIPAHFAVQMTHLVPPDIRTVHPNSALARRAVNQMVEDLSTQFNTGSIKAAPFVKEGDPKNILLSEAETWKADCILLGARGLSSVHRFLLGSVSMAVAARAHCSVEVIRS